MDDMQLLLVGATLAIIGGVVGDEFRSFLSRRREMNSIKIAISDELCEIEAVILSIHTVWESAKVFPPAYVNDLLSTTTTYDNLRIRLFLIKDATIRAELSAFYKKLRDTVRKTEGKIGTLDDTTESATEQNAFDQAFQKLGEEAKQLREKLK